MTTYPTSADGQVSHFVLTRFNVRMPQYAHRGDDWLPERVTLFDRYCLPTFKAQTSKRFTWLMFADSASPVWLRESLEQRLAGLGEVVYVDGVFTAQTAADEVRARTSTPFVITTRVDNDDAVADDFIATIQANFHEQTMEFINLVNGSQYSQRKVYLRPYTRNPFISLVEAVPESRSPSTVFVRRHYEVDQAAPVHNVGTDHPMWMQIVHGDNVLTELVGLRARASRVVPYFSCSLDVDDSVAGYLIDTARGGARILVRLIRKPKRIIDLGQSILARRGKPSVRGQ